jgi:hypothetical protein
MTLVVLERIGQTSCEALDFLLTIFCHSKMSGYQNKVSFYRRDRLSVSWPDKDSKVLITIAPRTEEEAGLSAASASEC